MKNRNGILIMVKSFHAYMTEIEIESEKERLYKEMMYSIVGS